MLAKPVWGQIVDDEALTRGLGDPEARLVVEWLVDQAEWLAECGVEEGILEALVARLCRRARSLVRFVWLWCYARRRGAALQLAGAERFTWPLPATAVDPYELLADILHWEAQEMALRLEKRGLARLL